MQQAYNGCPSIDPTTHILQVNLRHEGSGKKSKFLLTGLSFELMASIDRTRSVSLDILPMNYNRLECLIVAGTLKKFTMVTERVPFLAAGEGEEFSMRDLVPEWPWVLQRIMELDQLGPD